MEDPAALQSSVQANLVTTTRSITRLAAEDLSFHRSLHPSLSSAIDQQNARLLGLSERLLGSATAHVEAVRPSLKDIDDVEVNWTKVVDVIDSLLERADTALDEFTGAVKRLLPKDIRDRSLADRQRLADSYRTQDIEKPQLHFTNVVNNRPSQPFRPLLTSKPHSITPLQTEAILDEESQLPQFAHPYQREIELYIYPDTMYHTAPPIPYDSFEETSAIFVDTEEALDEMLQELKAAKEIAIDLEHHDTRTYTGLVCLMQISTRNKDWIVDTLKPWRRKLQCLNEVFTDPSIVKVLHGAHMDIIWLQRDLGLYIVGLFDTYHASRALGFPGGSYAYLLKRFTNIDAQKQYQMADWRLRPLPQPLIDYARSDTHYLLYIFDHLRNDAISRSHQQGDFDMTIDKIGDIMARSREVALQRYVYPTYDSTSGQGAGGWYKLLARTPTLLSKEKFAVFKAVHEWRDNVARDNDESVLQILSNRQLFSIAHDMPSTEDELKYTPDLSAIVRSKVPDLVAVVVKAKAEGVDGEDMIAALERIDPIAAAKRASHQTAPPKSNSILNAVGSLLPLRTLKSLFWGSTIKNPPSGISQQQKSKMSTLSPNLQFQLPLPPLSANVFTQAAQAEPEVAAPITPIPQPVQVSEAEEDVFTLRELGRKRKLAETDLTDGLASQTDQITLPSDEAERLAAKAERKRAKKEAKRATKAAADTATQVEDDTPYDYASAPSILHQPLPDKHDKKHGKKQVNPYAKALDTSKGLPRVQKERGGRSMTYAS